MQPLSFFNKAYIGEDGRIKGDTQTCYVLALVVGLVNGRKAELAAKYLVVNIEARDGHLSSGFIGTKDLMLTLVKVGRNDVACRLIHNDTFPSWWLSPSNTAPPASGSVGTAGRPKPASARSGRGAAGGR